MRQLEQETETLSHFVQGSLWKKTRAEFSAEDIVLPVII